MNPNRLLSSLAGLAALLFVLVSAGCAPLAEAPAAPTPTPIAATALPPEPTAELLPTEAAEAPTADPAAAQQKAVEWTLAQLQEDGSFNGFNPGATIDALLALAAAGVDVATLESGTGNTPLDYLNAQAEAYAETGASATAKLIAATLAAGGDPADVGGVDAGAKLAAYYNEASGAFGADTFAQAWGILGYALLGQEIPEAAIAFATESASEAGGWGFELNAAAPDVDSTALMLQALAAAGVPRGDEAVEGAFAYLHEVQSADGGFPGFDGASSASTTGLALQALAAYGESTDSPDWSPAAGASSDVAPNPMNAILTFQSPEGGFAGFAGANDPYSTYQALIGIAGVPYAPVP